MFQQFKNIFPGSTTINIRSLADSVGLNEEEWRTRGLESLEAIRSEIQNFNTLLSNKPNTNVARTMKQMPLNDAMEETAKIISRIQQRRNIIHGSNLENIEKAKRADLLLRNLLSRCDEHGKICTAMSVMSSCINATRQEIASTTQAASTLKNKLQELENRIDQTCLKYEEREFEIWKQQQEDNMQAEMVIKMNELRARQNQLNQIYEEHNEQQAKKRLELYDINFQSELEDYRRRRETEVSSLYSMNNIENQSPNIAMTTTLENLKLDNYDSGDLNTFLSHGDDNDDTDRMNKNMVDSALIDNMDSSSTAKVEVALHNNYSSDEDDTTYVEILADEDYESD